ncbi:MAG: putative DNA modification/repair radical SAM protein [Lachnospiraceae bacterium]|nr:putative DNA modification/repair radical SAM protein [Lachnospiraceae bacterium]
MHIQQEMDLYEKLNILTDAAKYDVACTSSGVDRRGDGKHMGNCTAPGICHSFSADGRCISLLKILFTNECIYDCKYCVNRSSNDVVRTSFTPEEVCQLTMEFYRRNFIEGLFLSSGILHSPDYTMELIYQTLFRLREEYHFRGYIHVKAIPGADPLLIEKTGFLADRMSVNLELPTAESLKKLAPNKSRAKILLPMRQVQEKMQENSYDLVRYRQAPRFVPAGQSTQMIIGATPESDFQIISVAEALYKKFSLKRVFYSAFVAVNQDAQLPALPGGPPLLREHRLYQADWLMRYYGFDAGELLNEKHPNFNPLLDPKCDWALAHLELFPVEVSRASLETLLRVPGIGPKSARRIVQARRFGRLDYRSLGKMGVVLKRALYFITCNGRTMYPLRMEEDFILRNLLAAEERVPLEAAGYRQMTLFDDFSEQFGVS